MTHEEWNELIGLYVADELPETLRESTGTYLANNPEAARDAEALRETVARLRALPSERPDPWFVERLLDGLLREHAAAEPHSTITAQTNTQ